MEKHSLVLTPDGICSIIEAKSVCTLSGVGSIARVILADKLCYEVEFVDGSHIVLSEDTLVY